VTLYVLIIEAVYDHGVVGVFTTREQADEVAKEMDEASDGHHAFRVEALELDVAYCPDCDLRMFTPTNKSPYVSQLRDDRAPYQARG
jgi:hypothetical protein